MAVGDTVQTQRVETYHVEVCHPGSDDWHHIHPPRWETTTAVGEATRYAGDVQHDHPGSAVRIVHATASEITTLATGKTSTLTLSTETMEM